MPNTASGGGQQPHNLAQLLDTLGEAPEDDTDTLTLGDIVETVGSRSFGPLLLVTGLLAASPLTGIPGMPTTLGVFVALIAVQLLLRRKHFWLPQWLVNRRVKRATYCKGLRFMRKPANFVDHLLKPRLEVVTKRVGFYAIALLCALIGVAMPSLELIPFSAHIAGLALTAFGLALIANDGLVGLVALAITGAAVVFVFVGLLN
jgi:hypothetical protein